MNSGVVVFVVVAIALPLLLAEFGDWCPWLADRIVRWAAGRLRDTTACQRYEEEWIANLNEIPGRLARLVAAFGYMACVPSMRRSISQQGGRAVLTGPSATPTAYLISSMYAPYLARIREVGIMLERLRAAADNNTQVRSFYVVGAEGIGKTTLATFCAGLLTDVFPDGRLYLSAKEMGSVDDGLRDLLLTDGVPLADIPKGTGDKRILLRLRLLGRRVLLLLDGVNPDQVLDLLGDDEPCPVLITSRRAPEKTALEQVLALRRLTRREASELLRYRLGGRVDAEPENFSKLITLLDQQPLLIGLAVELLTADPSISAAQFLTVIGDEIANPGPCSLAALHMICQNQPAEVRRLLLRLSLIHRTDFGAPEAALLVNEAPYQASQLLQALAAKGCLFSAGKPGRYILHPAVQTYASSRLAHEESPERIQELRELLKRNGFG